MKEIAGQHYFLNLQAILLLELALNIDAPHKIFHPSGPAFPSTFLKKHVKFTLTTYSHLNK